MREMSMEICYRTWRHDTKIIVAGFNMHSYSYYCYSICMVWYSDMKTYATAYVGSTSAADCSIDWSLCCV
jgi:hypothetical protein